MTGPAGDKALELGTCDPDPGVMPAMDVEAIERGIDRVVSLGNRFAGTDGEQRARAFVHEEFQATGLDDVRVEEFAFLAYEPRGAECRDLGDKWSLPCVGLQSTADGCVEGDAVYLGACTPDDIEAAERRGVTLEGKVVVAHSPFTFAVAPALAGERIAGLVNVSETPDGLIPHFTACFYPPPVTPPWNGRVLDFPGVTVEAEAGRRLLSAMTQRPVRLRVEHHAGYAERTTGNVVGVIPGSDAARERVIIGAHYDTQLEGPGAADNAAGVAVLIELARAWRALKPPRTIVLVGFAAEELASWGAYRYVLDHRDENGSTVGMINLDALGLPFPGTRVVVADAAMASFAKQTAERVGWSAEEDMDASAIPLADLNPFIDAGIPSCWLWRYPPQHPYYHSAGDVMRYVALENVIDIAHASAYVAFRLAHLPDAGLGRARPSRVWADIPG